MCVYATCTKSLSRNAYKKPWKRLSLFCLDLLPPLCLQWVWVSVSCAIVWKWLYTPSCTKSPIMPKHNKNTVGYMFSRSPHKSADILLERKCAATSESNRSCVFVFVCETTVVVLIPQPDPTLHWSCNDPPVSLQAPPLRHAWSCMRVKLNVELGLGLGVMYLRLQVTKISALPRVPLQGGAVVQQQWSWK